MTNKLGVYWAPQHGRPEDKDYISRLNPRGILIMNPDVQHISDAWRLSYGSLILLRDHPLSEQKDDAIHDPQGTGRRHAREWREHVDKFRQQAAERSIPFPPDDRIVVMGLNEPNERLSARTINLYYAAFLNALTDYHLRGTALELGVGWPADLNAKGKPDWSPYNDVLFAILKGNHFLGLHEYWYWTGPQDGWTWYAGRHLQCPFQVPIIITECGVDLGVDTERWKNEEREHPNRGWNGNISQSVYGEQMLQYMTNTDSRVQFVLPFLTDYQDRRWESFDTLPAREDLLLADQRLGSVAPMPHPPEGDFDRVMDFILLVEGEGPVVDSNGAWTKWGINQAYNPQIKDVRDLTWNQAKEHYRVHYWEASGAHLMMWPLNLVHMDCAVNQGGGR